MQALLFDVVILIARIQGISLKLLKRLGWVMIRSYNGRIVRKPGRLIFGRKKGAR